MAIRAREPGWADMLEEHVDWATAHRLIAQLAACEASALAFCRLLERWARGDAAPSTAGARQAALRHAADRVETALVGLERPLDRYLLELEAELILFCRKHLSPLKCPRSIDFEAELPRTPTGKLVKRHLRDRYWPKAAGKG